MTTLGFTDAADLASLFSPYDRLRVLTDASIAFEYRRSETRAVLRWTATVRGFVTGGSIEIANLPVTEARGNTQFMLNLEQLVTSAYENVRNMSKRLGGLSW